MTLASIVERHGRAIALVTLLAAGAGLVAGASLPSSIYPPLEFPRIVIIGHSGTLPARSMMLNVARPLEQSVMEVPGIRRVRSITFRGATEISAQFDPASDMVVSLQQVQSRLAEVRASLPEGTELIAERLTPAAFPMFIQSLTGPLAPVDLHDYAFYVMRPRLARVAGAGHVLVLASDTREIEVVADPARLLAAGLTVHDLAQALKATNQLAPVGRYATGGVQELVLASGLWPSLERIAETPVVVKPGATLRLSNIGEVFVGAPDRTTLVTGNGRDAAVVAVSQQIGANILDIQRGIQAAIDELARALPAGLRITKVYDLAEFVEAAIANVRDAIIIGGLLAVGVLLLFLREWRLTLVASITLPLTVVTTFLFMRWFGDSINLMSMGGLAVAIGLVIDDAVVVVEGIHRRVEEEGRERDGAERGEGAPRATELGGAQGSPPFKQVLDAVGELVAPVVSSTLTTVVVFAPLGLLSGVVGQFFRALSLTLSAAVLVSLVLALTLIPLLARWAVIRTRRPPGVAHRGRIDAVYTRSLSVMLRRPLLAVIAALALGSAGVSLYFAVGTGFLPQTDEGGFVIDYLTPAGTALEETDRQLKRVEQVLLETPEVASYSRRTGSELGLFATPQNSGDVLVRLKPRRERERSSEEVIVDLRGKLQRAAPGMEIEFVQLLQDMIGDLEGNPTPIEVKVFGDDIETLAAIGEEIEGLLEKTRGVVDVVGVKRGNPEITWEIDAAAAGRLGLTVEQVSAQISAAWLGEVATDFLALDRTIPVRVRYPDAIRFDATRLGETLVRGAEGRTAPISTIAKPQRSTGQTVLTRENLRQMALVTARLEDRDLGSAVVEITSKLRQLRLPVGYTWEVGGQYLAQRQAFRELLEVLAIASALVFAILVIHFRAFTPALLILAAAPLSLAGALVALIATDTELNVSSAMGVVLLVGLVVKNGIVLLDYADRELARGASRPDAVLRAARVRLRPILMTTLCTLFGLLPLALGFGAGAELQRPLALTVIGGLSLSTLVTLYLVPALYVGRHGANRP
ncbi:MAG: efflux RND transporter permease subunit [Acidobacteria bacterium]|nr:efflux RND transporter permease subunit [Acidobacteriota bacterium]